MRKLRVLIEVIGRICVLELSNELTRVDVKSELEQRLLNFVLDVLVATTYSLSLAKFIFLCSRSLYFNQIAHLLYLVHVDCSHIAIECDLFEYSCLVNAHLSFGLNLLTPLIVMAWSHSYERALAFDVRSVSYVHRLILGRDIWVSSPHTALLFDIKVRQSELHSQAQLLN